MSDLITAAKAVIYDWDKYQIVHLESVNMLCAAVERAENQEAVGFEDEPVAWLVLGKDMGSDRDIVTIGKPTCVPATPLYLRPYLAQKKITDEEIQFIWGSHDKSEFKHYIQFAKAIMRKINGED